jgi:hypothetical protein
MPDPQCNLAAAVDRGILSLDAAEQGLGVAPESAAIAVRHMAEDKLKPVIGRDKAAKVKAHFARSTPRALRGPRRWRPSSPGYRARRRSSETLKPNWAICRSALQRLHPRAPRIG